MQFSVCSGFPFPLPLTLRGESAATESRRRALLLHEKRLKRANIRREKASLEGRNEKKKREYNKTASVLTRKRSADEVQRRECKKGGLRGGQLLTKLLLNFGDGLLEVLKKGKLHQFRLTKRKKEDKTHLSRRIELQAQQ